jgi:hypothetical protein
VERVVANPELTVEDLNLLITALSHYAQPESAQYEACYGLGGLLIAERDRLNRIEARRLAQRTLDELA